MQRNETLQCCTAKASGSTVYSQRQVFVPHLVKRYLVLFVLLFWWCSSVNVSDGNHTMQIDSSSCEGG